MAFPDRYPYLGASLLLLGTFLLLSLFRRDHQRWVWLSALAAFPFGFLSYLYVPLYWKPVRIAEWFLTGPEDLITALATGGLIGWLAFAFFPNRLAFHFRAGVFMKRYLGFFAIGMGLSGGFHFVGLQIGWPFSLAPLLATVCTGVGILLLRPALWPCAAAAGLGFTFAHTWNLSAAFQLWPHFRQQWRFENLLGLSIGGLPADELAWAFCTGFAWAAYIGYAFDAHRVMSRERLPRREQSALTGSLENIA